MGAVCGEMDIRKRGEVATVQRIDLRLDGLRRLNLRLSGVIDRIRLTVTVSDG